MSEFVKRQEELRSNLTMQIRDVIDGAESEGRGLDQAELTKIDRIEADIDSASRSIEVAAKSEVRAAEVAEASRSFAPVEEARGAADVFRAMAKGEIRGHDFTMEKRATLVPSANTVPVDFLDRVYALAKLVGPYLETSEVFQRDSGSDLRVPVMTAYSTATETAAGAAMDESENTYSSLLLQPAKQGFIVKLANELIQDQGFDIESSIIENAGVAIGTRVNTIVNAAVEAVAGAGVTAASATAITADELIELAFSTDGLVRLLPGTGFMVAPSTMALIRKLKDSDGRYILDPIVSSVDGNASATLLGFPVYENPAVDAATTGNQAAFFGHWPSVKIATTGLATSVSTDAYFANDITGYRFTYRIAAGVANGSSHISKLTMA
jgi:HK97 family phage major capsid protein